jgi:hypothetical protein
MDDEQSRATHPPFPPQEIHFPPQAGTISLPQRVRVRVRDRVRAIGLELGLGLGLGLVLHAKFDIAPPSRERERIVVTRWGVTKEGRRG